MLKRPGLISIAQRLVMKSALINIFYRYKPLRTLEEVADDIIALEQKSEGMIAQILGIKVAEVQGE